MSQDMNFSTSCSDVPAKPYDVITVVQKSQ